MSVWRLVGMEIWHRKLNFAISLLAIVVAVAYAVGSLLLIDAHQQQSAQRVADMDDEIRKITKAMGFNINVLPADQNLADFHANDFADKTMPYEYVNRLAESPIVQSVRHLRPALIRKTEWPEFEREIVLDGCQRGRAADARVESQAAAGGSRAGRRDDRGQLAGPGS